MRDQVLLADCLVENDVEAARRARQKRREALILSVVLEGILVGAMLVWPIFTPGVLPPKYSLVPVPPYRGGGAHRANPEHTSSNPHERWPKAFPNPNVVYRPVIPDRIASSNDTRDTDDTLWIGEGNGSGTAPGVEFGTGNSNWMPKPPDVKPPETPAVIHRSEGVQEALLERRIQPVYPQGALLMHMSGTVELRAIIATDGSVSHLEVLSGNPLLAQAAVAAVRQWRYRPTLLSGHPVEVETLITVNFVLTH